MAGELSSSEVNVEWASLLSDILIRVATVVANKDGECRAQQLEAAQLVCSHWNK
jgi:hypothetical protein